MNTPLQKFKNYCRKTDARLFFVADDGAILFSARFIASLISYLTTIVSLEDLHNFHHQSWSGLELNKQLRSYTVRKKHLIYIHSIHTQLIAKRTHTKNT